MRKLARSRSSRSRAAWYSPSVRRHRSSSIAYSAQLPQEPDLRHLPIAHDRFGRYLQDLGGLLHAESAKEAQFNNLTLSRVSRGQRRQRIVDSHQIRPGLPGHSERVINRDVAGAASSLDSVPRTSKVGQDAPHQPRTDREEVGAVLPGDLDIDQLHVDFVDKRRRLK